MRFGNNVAACVATPIVQFLNLNMLLLWGILQFLRTPASLRAFNKCFLPSLMTVCDLRFILVTRKPWSNKIYVAYAPGDATHMLLFTVDVNSVIP
jgi:hypothetical protein